MDRKKLNKFCIVILFLGLIVPCQVLAETFNVKGRFSYRQKYDSNYYRSYTNEESVWTLNMAPGITVEYLGKNNTALLSYSPILSINQQTDDYELDHSANFEDMWRLSRLFRISLSDSFRYSSDFSDEDESSGSILSDKTGRNRYWTNSFYINGRYQYAASGSMIIGFQNSLFRNIDGRQSDWDRNIPSISISHQFNRGWGMTGAYSYDHGDFVSKKNVRTHKPSFGLHHNYSEHGRVWVNYSYSKADYEWVRGNYAIQNGSIGLSHQMSEQSDISISGGGYYLVRDDSVGEQGYNYQASASQKWKRLSLFIKGSGGLDELHFNGASEGLTEYWSADAQADYTPMDKLSFGVHGFFRNNKFLEKINPEKEDTFGGGGHLRYVPGRDYAVSLRYNYRQLDSSRLNTGYEDHQILLELTIMKDFIGD